MNDPDDNAFSGWLTDMPNGQFFGADRTVPSVRWNAPVKKRTTLERVNVAVLAFKHAWKWGWPP